MGQVGQMLSQNDFLGGLGNLEGSFLIGIVSIVYSLAIAVIPFIAKRIVSGDVGSTAVAMVGTAVTALTAGAAGFEGAAAGVAAGASGFSGRKLRRGFRRRSDCGICTSALGRRRAGTSPRRRNRLPSQPHRAAVSRSATAAPTLEGPCGSDSQLDQ